MKKLVSVIVPNNDRDTKTLRNSLPTDVEYIEVNLGLERSEQRNIGIKRAKGECLLILDSDQSISPCLIKECLSLISMGHSCVYIPEVIVGHSWFAKLRNFERSFYTSTCVDVPRFVLKRACPLFDVNMSGPEDADWGNRIPGLRATSKACLYHHDDISLSQYLKKKAYYTKSMRLFAKKWPEDKCLDLSYRCFGVFTEKGKWRKLIQHPILTIGIVLLLALRGVIYYANK
jgi:glycosyltransferase involved in cell wall biosynthesis